MTPVHMSLCVILAAAAGCARTSADRPLAGPDEPAGRVERPRTPAKAPVAAKNGRPVTVSGVFIDDQLATACGIPLVPEAYFEYDSAAVEPGDNPILRRIADCLTTGPLHGRKIELRGYSDPRGPAEYSEQLGVSRAQSVSDFLTTQGVEPDDITIHPGGQPAPAPDVPSDWPYERRVDIALLPTD